MKNQIQRDISSKRLSYSIIISWLFNLPIPLSKNYNAIYNREHFCYGLLLAMINNTTVATCTNSIKIILKTITTDEWFRMIFAKIARLHRQKMFFRIVQQQITELKERKLWPKEVNIAIDLHKRIRYDKTLTKYIMYGMFGNTPKICEKYMTAQIAHHKVKLKLAVLNMSKYDKNVDFVRKIIKTCSSYEINIGVFLLDREFFTARIFQTFIETNQRFLMICKDSPAVKKYIKEFREGKRPRVSKAIIQSKNKLKIPYTLIIEVNPRKNGSDLIAYATNCPKINPKKYAKRWIIETGYSNMNSMGIKSSSRNQHVRELMFMYTALLYNAWIMARIITNKENLFYVNKHEPKLNDFQFILLFHIIIQMFSLSLSDDPG